MVEKKGDKGGQREVEGDDRTQGMQSSLDVATHFRDNTTKRP